MEHNGHSSFGVSLIILYYYNECVCVCVGTMPQRVELFPRSVLQLLGSSVHKCLCILIDMPIQNNA
ncbi:unnamed protein product [Camellia sinensis]